MYETPEQILALHDELESQGYIESNPEDHNLYRATEKGRVAWSILERSRQADLEEVQSSIVNATREAMQQLGLDGDIQIGDNGMVLVRVPRPESEQVPDGINEKPL